MTTIIALAVLGLLASVSAHRGDGGGGGFGGFGGFGGAGGFGGWWNSCSCRNQCSGNSGTRNVACYNTRSQYLQCADTVCSIQTCPANQLFNYTTLVCESCSFGFHVDALKRKCVCDQGTTLNYATGTCGPCPTAATVTADYCSCTGALVLDKVNNACKACPTGSTFTRRGCQCTNAKQFWSTADFACKDCPGSWIAVNVGNSRRSRTINVCQCPTANNIVNPYSITCVACPTNSVFTQWKGNSYCQCTIIGQVYDPKTNTCVAGSQNQGFDLFGLFGSSEGK